MKKYGFAGLLALPALLLAGCATVIQPLSFSANWRRNTALGGDVAGTHETLEYELSFESTPRNGYSVSYTEGTLKTELKNDTVTADGERKNGYVYTTELNVSVQFTVDGKSGEVFRDKVTSRTEFLTVEESLCPIRSEKQVTAHTPLDYPLAVESAYTLTEYSCSVEYTSEKNNVVGARATTRTDGKETVREYDLSGSGTFLDNETILFALRSQTFASAVAFRTINPVSGSDRAAIAMTTVPREVTREVQIETEEGELKESIPCVSVAVYYNGSRSGQRQTVIYAKKSNSSDNTYRNAPVYIESPIVYNLGILKYTLVRADFSD